MQQGRTCRRPRTRAYAATARLRPLQQLLNGTAGAQTMMVLQRQQMLGGLSQEYQHGQCVGSPVVGAQRHTRSLAFGTVCAVQ